MRHSNDVRRPRRRGRQIVNAVLVLLAAVGWVRAVGAVDAPGRIGAGLVNALAIDPHAGAMLYAGTECGGVLNSTDGGGTWIVANTGLPEPIFVAAIAIDPSTPSTLYAATNGGVFKNTDGGSTWVSVNTGLPGGTNLVAIAINPVTPSTLYTGTQGNDAGVFKSTDGGGTWRAANKSTDAGATWGATGLTKTFVGALAIDPITPETLYAGTGYYQHDGGGVFRSTDAGATWSATGLTNTFGLGALGIDPRMPSTLYAAPGGGVFTSTDAGATWNAVNTGLPEYPAGNTYVSALVIDPVTPRTLYAATYSGVFKSTNGGGTWNAANEGVDPTCAAGFLEDGSMDHPHLGICNGPEEVQFSGMGPAGSARLDLRLESWSIEPSQSDGGACTVDPANPANGLDGMPCTDDDPGRAAGTGAEANTTGEGGGAWVGPYHPQTVPLPHEFTLRLTTARAAAEIQDFGNERGRIVSGEVEGTPLRCEALDRVLLDSKLAGAIVALDTDVVATFALSSGVPVCAGDCDGSGSVTVDELIIGVNIALGSTPIDHCASFDTSSDGQVAIDELIAAVGAALNACGQ